MAKLEKQVGSTSEIWQIFIQDSSSSTGAGLTALTSGSSGLTAYYHRDTDTTATAISLVTMTVGSFTSSGFKLIDDTNMPGAYQFCPPNAALASGAKSVLFMLKGAANMAPLPIEVQLIGVPVDIVAGAAGGLFISGTNSSLTVTGGITVTQSTSNGHGIAVTGNGTGDGVRFTSGNGATGSGFRVDAASTNGVALRFAGSGTGEGMYAVGGATGNAVSLNGGATSGDGLNVMTTSGHGINLIPSGASKHAVLATGSSTSGTCNGFSMVAGTNGVALLAANLATDADLADAVWDEAIAGHLSAGSTGLSLNSASSAGDPWGIALPGVYASGTAGHIVGTALPDIAPGATNGLFRGGSNAATSITTALTANIIGAITGNVTGSLSGSVGSVTGAVGSVTSGVTLAAAAITNASIAADSGLKSIRSNTAQAGAATTITLDTSASAVNNFYNNDIVLLTGGTGAGQARFISAYVGATKVATVAAWVTNPDSSTTFAILPYDAVAGATAPTAAQVATAVWQDATPGDFTAASSIGKGLYTTGIVPGASGGIFLAGSTGENAIADALLDRADGVEVGLTPRQQMRLNAAALAGVLTGAATTTVVIKNAVANTKARITATVDTSGNRTAVTTDVT